MVSSDLGCLGCKEMAGAFHDLVPAKEAASEWNREEDAVLYKTSRKEIMQDTSNTLQDKQTSRYCFRYWQCLNHCRMMMLWLLLCFSTSTRRQLTKRLRWKAGAGWKLGFHSSNGHRSDPTTRHRCALEDFETHVLQATVAHPSKQPFNWINEDSVQRSDGVTYILPSLPDASLFWEYCCSLIWLFCPILHRHIFFSLRPILIDPQGLLSLVYYFETPLQQITWHHSARDKGQTIS